jgi:TetR/AcrR family transcriptional repressor of nem operon
MPKRRPRRGSREVSKQETREALIAAALTEFAAHGIDAPSLDAICARAGYTRGAFYVHFRDREELMAAVVERVMGGFLEAIIARGEEAHELAQTIERFADAVAHTLGGPRSGRALVLPLPEGVPFARVLEAITRRPELRASFRALLERAVGSVGEVTAHGQRARTVRHDVDPSHVGALLVLIALGVLVALDTGLALDPGSLCRTVLALLSRPRRP